MRNLKDEIIVRVQRDFPNCQKYTKCCRVDKPFWDELNSKLKEIEHKKQPFREKRVTIIHTKPPEGFDGW